MSDPRAKPIPLADELSAPFWAGARRNHLVIQRCGACAYYNFPARAVCDVCLSPELAFEPVSGRGTIYSFTIMHQKDVAGFEQDWPFINVVVELNEQPMLLMVGNLPISERERVRIGAPVAVEFEQRGEGVVIPQFKVAS